MKALILGALLIATPVVAQEKSLIIKEIIETCAAEVRSKGGTLFDVYFSPLDGKIYRFGTDRDDFLFKKCLANTYNLTLK
jgi:hypothetical protein